MAEFIVSADQEVALNQSAILTPYSPCTRNTSVMFQNGNIILRGVVNNPYAQYAVFDVQFIGNIAIPTGGTVGSIAVGITANGTLQQDSVGIVTPAAVEEFENIIADTRLYVYRGTVISPALTNIVPSVGPITIRGGSKVKVTRVA